MYGNEAIVFLAIALIGILGLKASVEWSIIFAFVGAGVTYFLRNKK